MSFDFKDWLGEKCDLAEIEARYSNASGVVFGGVHKDWEKLKALMQPGDELWSYCSPPESWRVHAGRQGFAVMRGDQLVGSIVTMMN